MENYYSVLGVSRSASASEIKHAYRLCAQQWHPDKRPSDTNAEKQFILIQEAYRTLMDPFKRSNHNSFLGHCTDPGNKSKKLSHSPNTRHGRNDYLKGFWPFIVIHCSVVAFLVVILVSRPPQHIVLSAHRVAETEAKIIAHAKIARASEEVAQLRKAIKEEQKASSARFGKTHRVALTSEIFKETHGQHIANMTKEMPVVSKELKSAGTEMSAHAARPSSTEIYSLNTAENLPPEMEAN